MWQLREDTEWVQDCMNLHGFDVCAWRSVETSVTAEAIWKQSDTCVCTLHCNMQKFVQAVFRSKDTACLVMMPECTDSQYRVLLDLHCAASGQSSDDVLAACYAVGHRQQTPAQH